MVIIFHDYVVDNNLLPDGGLAVKYVEAMEGEGPDGQAGIVGTGNSFSVRMTKEVAINYILEAAITLGLMPDKDKPEVADLAQMRAELEKRRQSTGKQRPGR